MTVEASTDARRTSRNQLLLLGGIFAAVVAVLALGYFLFLRTDYVVLVQDLRPADASAIVAELDKGGKTYRLRDGGATILVPTGEADATRVAIAGSEAAARGQIGFELFNKSDMGLTNFAQKINYQRALQGELVRTITMMDGVESARVHLALPEKALFRGDRSEPKAAVTVSMKPGQTADASRVAGIQRLVAAAVPDLPESKVVVLDSGGRVISPVVATQAGIERPADLEERSALEGYYRARARGAVERLVPGLKFAVRVLAFPAGQAAPATDGAAAVPGEWVPSGDGNSRNFRLRVLFVTETPLGAEDQALVRDAVVQAAALDTGLGDSFAFETGPVDPIAPVVAQPSLAALPPQPVSQPEIAERQPAWLASWWLWAAAALAVAGLIAWQLRRRGRARLNGTDHDDFAARLRRQLSLEEGPDAAA